MTKTQHTQGPWCRNISPATKYPTVFAGRCTHVAVVCTGGLPPEEVEANINLIAAAPDLLATLSALDDAGYLDDIYPPTAALARAAIAKAKGA